jgi:SAM-dependent methyltransferase
MMRGADRADPRPSQVEPGRSLYAHELDRWLLDALRVGRGATALELAAGAGELSLRLAERVRPGGTVICSDLRASRVTEAARNARLAGAAEIEARVIDMLDVDLPDASVDAVLCRWGFMFPVPSDAALREALAVWGDPRRNPWTTLIDAALREAGYDPPDRLAPGQMLSLADPARLEVLLRASGFGQIEIAEIPLAWTYPDAAAYWEVDVRWPGGPIDVPDM